MQTRCLRFLLAACLSWIPALLWADSGPQTSAKLEDLLAEALKNNPEIQAAHNGVLAARALRPQAWGLDNPVLRMENDDAHKNPFDGQSAEQNRIGFSQTIPFPAKFFERSNVAAKELAVAQARYDQAVNEVLRSVKVAYW